MKRLINLSATLVLISLFTTISFGQVENSSNIQNRNMVKAQSFTGQTTQGPNWVDANGDGICDNVGTENQGTGAGKGLGLKDGSGTRQRPQDGTGFGKGSGSNAGVRTGDCDGTGFSGSGTNSRKGRK